MFASNAAGDYAASDTWGLLGEADAETIVEGWSFLQRLGSALRVVENRSISDLDEERGDLESLARRLGYASTGREGGSRRALLSDYERHTEKIRAIYDRIFAPTAASPHPEG